MLLQLFIEGIHFLHDLDKYPLAFEVMNQVLINLLREKNNTDINVLKGSSQLRGKKKKRKEIKKERANLKFSRKALLYWKEATSKEQTRWIHLLGTSASALVTGKKKNPVILACLQSFRVEKSLE